jgi:hypothetical protein
MNLETRITKLEQAQHHGVEVIAYGDGGLTPEQTKRVEQLRKEGRTVILAGPDDLGLL